jgi:quercetin dioxygenase-like cupin family protein
MPRTDVLTWDDVSPAVTDGVDRRAVPGTGADVRRIVIPAGTRASRHSHDHEQFLLVLEGRARLSTEEGEVELRPGSIVRFDAHAWHAAAFVSDTVLVEVNLRPTGA